MLGGFALELKTGLFGTNLLHEAIRVTSVRNACLCSQVRSVS